MRDSKEMARYGLNALLRAGADKAQCILTMSQKHEMNVDAGALSLLRTTFDTQVNLTAIKDGRRAKAGSISRTPRRLTARPRKPWR